jgi:hypothetical protein
VKPFVYGNINALLHSISIWDHEDIFPCMERFVIIFFINALFTLHCSSNHKKIDLVFWFHRDIECNPSLIHAIEIILSKMPSVRACFDKVYFLSAGIPEKYDYYGDGTIIMFYRYVPIGTDSSFGSSSCIGYSEINS